MTTFNLVLLSSMVLATVTVHAQAGTELQNRDTVFLKSTVDGMGYLTVPLCGYNAGSCPDLNSPYHALTLSNDPMAGTDEFQIHRLNGDGVVKSNDWVRFLHTKSGMYLDACSNPVVAKAYRPETADWGIKRTNGQSGNIMEFDEVKFLMLETYFGTRYMDVVPGENAWAPCADPGTTNNGTVNGWVSWRSDGSDGPLGSQIYHHAFTIAKQRDPCTDGKKLACLEGHKQECTPGSDACGACTEAWGGSSCDCPLNTDPLQGAKASTVVLGNDATGVRGGNLVLHFEQSPMLRTDLMVLGLDGEGGDAGACRLLFTWTRPTEDCTKTAWEGTAPFAEVISTCNPTVDTSSSNQTVLTFHFNVENARDVQIANEWKLQTSTTYMPVQVTLQKTFETSTSKITVEEIITRFLRIEFTVDDASAVSDDDLKTALAADLSGDIVLEAGDVDINKIGVNVVARVRMVPEHNAADLESTADGLLLGSEGETKQLFGGIAGGQLVAAEVITTVIAPSGVLQAATARLGEDGTTPTLTVQLYAQAGFPYKLDVTSGEYPGSITAAEDWALLGERDACTDTGAACGSTFELVAEDVGAAKGTFTGVYKVEFDVTCHSGVVDNSKCAVFGRGSTASLLFTIETGTHQPQVLDGVTLDGELAVTALDYGNAQAMSAFLNDEFVYVVASVTSEQAELVRAQVILVSLDDEDDEDASSITLWNTATTQDGLGVEFETDSDTSETAAGGTLNPKFKFKTNMTVINQLNPQGDFIVSVTLEVDYKGLGDQNRRRLLTTRNLLAQASTIVGDSSNSLQLTVALSAGDAGTADALTNAGMCDMPGSWVVTMLGAMLSLTLQ